MGRTRVEGLTQAEGMGKNGREERQGQSGVGGSRCNRTKVEKGGRQGFMSRVILLLTVAYYGNFLKLSVASAENNANRKWIIIGL